MASRGWFCSSSPVVAAVWAPALWWWNIRLLVPAFGWCVLQASKILHWKVLMHHLALTVFLSWSGAEATCPDWAQETVVINLEVLLNLLNLTGGLSPWKRYTEYCCLVSRQYWHTKKSCQPWWCPRPDTICLHQNVEAREGYTVPYHSSFLWSAVGAPNRCNTSIHPDNDKECDPSFPVKDSNCPYSHWL